MKEFVLIAGKSYHGIIQVIDVEFVRKCYMKLEAKDINQYLEEIGEEVVLVALQEKEEVGIKKLDFKLQLSICN